VLDEVEACGVNVGMRVGEAIDESSVGNGIGVSVASGVRVGTSVGGNGVSVGIAPCVAATIVNAAATAVFCTSTGLAVGVAFAPHELTNRLNSTTMIHRFLFIDS